MCSEGKSYKAEIPLSFLARAPRHDPWRLSEPLRSSGRAPLVLIRNLCSAHHQLRDSDMNLGAMLHVDKVSGDEYQQVVLLVVPTA